MVELGDESADKETLMENIQKDLQEKCVLRIDEIEFVGKGIIPRDRKLIMDQRTWEKT